MCAWCETSGPAGVSCIHCSVDFYIPTGPLPRPPAPDRYSANERAAFTHFEGALRQVVG